MNDNPEFNDLPTFPNDGPIFDYMISTVFPQDIESGPIYKVLKNAEDNAHFQSMWDATNVHYTLSEFTIVLSKIKREYDRLCSNYNLIRDLYEKQPEMTDSVTVFSFIYGFNKAVKFYTDGTSNNYSAYKIYKSLCQEIKELINIGQGSPSYESRLSDICHAIHTSTEKWNTIINGIRYYLVSDMHKKEYIDMKKKLSELDMYDELFS